MAAGRGQRRHGCRGPRMRPAYGVCRGRGRSVGRYLRPTSAAPPGRRAGSRCGRGGRGGAAPSRRPRRRLDRGHGLERAGHRHRTSHRRSRAAPGFRPTRGRDLPVGLAGPGAWVPLHARGHRAHRKGGPTAAHNGLASPAHIVLLRRKAGGNGVGGRPAGAPRSPPPRRSSRHQPPPPGRSGAGFPILSAVLARPGDAGPSVVGLPGRPLHRARPSAGQRAAGRACVRSRFSESRSGVYAPSTSGTARGRCSARERSAGAGCRSRRRSVRGHLPGEAAGCP